MILKRSPEGWPSELVGALFDAIALLSDRLLAIVAPLLERLESLVIKEDILRDDV